MNKDRLIYRVSTTLLALLFAAGAMMYVFNYPRAEGFFLSLGFPVWIIYPLAALKLAGAITVWTRFSGFLKELAYAGFLYDAVLALAAHIMVLDGEYAPAIVAIVLTVTSWVYDRRVYGHYRQEPAAAPA